MVQHVIQVNRSSTHRSQVTLFHWNHSSLLLAFLHGNNLPLDRLVESCGTSRPKFLQLGFANLNSVFFNIDVVVADKARVAEVYPYFVSKRFINHSIIIKSCQTCPAHIVMCYNAKTGVTETLLTIIFEPKTARFTSARHVLSYVITPTRAQIQIKCCCFSS